MITVIHGEDINSSRKCYIGERKKIKNPIIFYGDSINLTDIAQALYGKNFFEDETRYLFIEDLFLKKTSQEIENIAKYLQKDDKSNIFVWEQKNLTKKQLGIFKTPIVRSFSFPKSLFLFLSEIKPNNAKRSIRLFHQTLVSTEAQLVFYLIIRQFRLLLSLVLNSNDNIDEIKTMHGWQKSKLYNQASMFSELSLRKIYKKIYDLEVSFKSGTNILSTVYAIDFLLLSI